MTIYKKGAQGFILPINHNNINQAHWDQILTPQIVTYDTTHGWGIPYDTLGINLDDVNDFKELENYMHASSSNIFFNMPKNLLKDKGLEIFLRGYKQHGNTTSRLRFSTNGGKYPILKPGYITKFNWNIDILADEAFLPYFLNRHSMQNPALALPINIGKSNAQPKPATPSKDTTQPHYSQNKPGIGEAEQFSNDPDFWNRAMGNL